MPDLLISHNIKVFIIFVLVYVNLKWPLFRMLQVLKAVKYFCVNLASLVLVLVPAKYFDVNMMKLNRLNIHTYYWACVGTEFFG